MQRRWFFSSLLLLLLSQFALSLDVDFISSLKQRLRARHEIADLEDSTEASVEELFLFTDTEVEATGARCLDGSNYGFYFRPGTGSGQTKWMMSLQGGGYCLPNPPSENIDDCHERIKTKLGTSTVWKTTKKVGELHSTDPSKNPDFYNWNVVTLPYCSGDVHSGTRRSQVEGFFFSGHLNFMASIKKLWSFGLGNATEVFLGGVSAGGVGTFINTDWLLSALPATAQLRAIPNAGWFLPVPPYSSEVAPISEGMKQIVQLGASYVNQQCAAAYPNETFICLSANHSYPFMPVPTFVAEHIYDSDELLVENGVPNEPNNPKVLAYVAEYGKLTVQTLQQVVANQRDGLFVPSCLEHDVYWNEELVQGQTWQQTTSFWYRSSSAGKTKVVDNCSGIACNPTCPDDQTYKLKNVIFSA